MYLDIPETVFTWSAPPIKFGAGAVDELSFDVARLGMERVLVVTDAGIVQTGIPERILDRLGDSGVKADLFDGVHVEPTDESVGAAVEFASSGEWDGFVAVGGGSTIDTAKALNLLTSHPAELETYLNRPVGKGKPVPGPLRPLVAVPTTAGTGSECTPVCILDVLSLHVKTGISDAHLRPSLAVIDPVLTLSLPPEVTAACGMDVVCHALESYTSRAFTARPRHRPEERTQYVGANPVSDLFCERALRLAATSFRTAVHSRRDLDARADMMLAATFAGLGFGNAGVHIPHACGYPIAGMVEGYRPAGYPDEPLVPHGQSVAVTAPAAFRFTYPAWPERHARAAQLLDGERKRRPSHPRDHLPETLIDLMQDLEIPNGVGAFGYTAEHVPTLVDGAMKQQRLLENAPRDPTPEAIGAIFKDSMTNW
jgi:hydroxyacid-oxoacid transhydrogenase